jgi:hypothetical protein
MSLEPTRWFFAACLRLKLPLISEWGLLFKARSLRGLNVARGCGGRITRQSLHDLNSAQHVGASTVTKSG